MKFDQVATIVGSVPCMTPDQGKILYDFILENDIRECLELGFFHGTSSCYMAAALHENGRGHLTTIDVVKVKDRTPNIHELLRKTGLGDYVEPVFADLSYTWELMKIIERQSRDGACRPIYDFCYLDGPHTWETDGLGFFLVAKLLKPGGWILFDDLTWTFGGSPGFNRGGKDFLSQMPEDQRTTPQVEKIFSLLVRQHPDFEEFHVGGNWGWARKKCGPSHSPVGTGGLKGYVGKLKGFARRSSR